MHITYDIILTIEDSPYTGIFNCHDDYPLAIKKYYEFLSEKKYKTVSLIKNTTTNFSQIILPKPIEKYKINKVSFSKIYKNISSFILGILFERNEHRHEEDGINEQVITIGFLWWGIDVHIDKRYVL